jgi:transcriptional regulator with XRE-family HTH domain
VTRKAQRRKRTEAGAAKGRPKGAQGRPSDAQVRAIHASYIAGYATIKALANAIDCTEDSVRKRMRALGLPMRTDTKRVLPPADTPGHAEQRQIIAVLLAKVDALRVARGLSWERLARVAGLSQDRLQAVRFDLADPRLTTVLRLCRALGVSTEDLVGELPLPQTPRESRHTKRRGRERAAAETEEVSA